MDVATPLAKRVTHCVEKRQNSLEIVVCWLSLKPRCQTKKKVKEQLMDSVSISGHTFISSRIMLNAITTIPQLFHCGANPLFKGENGSILIPLFIVPSVVA